MERFLWEVATVFAEKEDIILTGSTFKILKSLDVFEGPPIFFSENTALMLYGENGKVKIALQKGHNPQRPDIKECQVLVAINENSALAIWQRNTTQFNMVFQDRKRMEAEEKTGIILGANIQTMDTFTIDGPENMESQKQKIIKALQILFH